MSKPESLSFIAALFISVIVSAVFVFYFAFGFLLFLSALLIFSVSFLVILFFIKKYIYSNIKDIHLDLIQQFDDDDSHNKQKQIFSDDAIRDLNAGVQRWSKERKEEVVRLKKLENYRKEFLGNVSHELKTPVFNIQGYILTLLDGGLEDKNINRDYLQRAEKSVERMAHIIEDLESITQLEAGELELEIEKIDIFPMAKEVIDSLERLAEEKNIHIVIEKFNTDPVWVLADKFRLRQVFLNLVVNSIKYGKTGGETRIIFRDAGKKVIVEVADNGIGIDKKFLHRIFERFYRVDKSRSREAGGTGLGLSIVEHIIAAHGQTISVLSTPGVGTVFSFPLRKG